MVRLKNEKIVKTVKMMLRCVLKHLVEMARLIEMLEKNVIIEAIMVKMVNVQRCVQNMILINLNVEMV